MSGVGAALATPVSITSLQDVKGVAVLDEGEAGNSESCVFGRHKQVSKQLAFNAQTTL